MSDRLDLGTPFQTDGLFWTAEAEDSKFAGHIASDGKSIRFTSAARLAGPQELFSEPAEPEILQGVTILGPVTLIGFHADGGKRSQLGDQVLVIDEFRVDAAVVGCQIENDTAPVVSSVWLTYDGTELWFPKAGSESFTKDEFVISFPLQPPAFLDVLVNPIQTRITARSFSNLQTKVGVGHTSRTETRIEIEPKEPKSLQWFYDIAHRLENFLSLCLGTSVRLRTVRVKTSTGETGWFVCPRKSRKAATPRRQIWVRCDSIQLSAAIGAWFSTPEEFRPLENLIYGTIRQSSMFVETEFLSLAQAIESFHRLTTPASSIVDSKVFKKVLKSLCALINSVCHSSALEERLLDSIRHANEPSFKNRIEELLSRITREHAQKLLGDPAKFEQTLRQTRNYFTHAGTSKKANVLTDPKELFLFNQKLHGFLRLSMLMHIGFPENDVFGLVEYQCGRWF